MGDVPPQHHLEPGQAVVAEGATDEDFVLVVQGRDLDVVVQDDAPEVRERLNTGLSLGWAGGGQWKQTNKQSVSNKNKKTKQIYFVVARQDNVKCARISVFRKILPI